VPKEAEPVDSVIDGDVVAVTGGEDLGDCTRPGDDDARVTEAAVESAAAPRHVGATPRGPDAHRGRDEHRIGSDDRRARGAPLRLDDLREPSPWAHRYPISFA
jgi:hypothetical protein